MFTQETLLAAILTGGFSLALAFAPFFLSFPQVAVGLSVSILALAVATGIHDTWWVRRKVKPAASEPLPLRKAA